MKKELEEERKNKKTNFYYIFILVLFMGHLIMLSIF
jgi:hypothetical protein